MFQLLTLFIQGAFFSFVANAAAGEDTALWIMLVIANAVLVVGYGFIKKAEDQ